MTKYSSGSEPIFLKTFIEDLHPGWTLRDWFHWPPDTFALSSVFLGDSGTHRYSVSPPFHVKDWPSADWPDLSRDLALGWRRWLAGLDNHRPPGLEKLFKALEDLSSKVFVHDLYSASKLEQREKEWEVCRTFIELHAVADQACEAFGLHRIGEEQQALMHLHLVANLLLTTRGTLSQLPREKGIVLPKMRTPQVGLTLRSLSHHLTFHRSEVDIAWRAAPWLNRDEDTVNILVVPWPDKVDATYFKPVLHSGSSQRLGTARYFSYSRESSKKKFEPEAVIQLIEQASKEVNRIHLLVFPETALSRDELIKLRFALEERFKAQRDRIPIVIAGITEAKNKNGIETSLDDDGFSQAGPAANHSNRVSLSVFYGEKWYEMTQDKHHRWRLDTNQIRQYQLGGVLTGGKLWWEAINVPKRRLSFFAPNAWLTICPLICEDLARLEPVSELIRGVGPTLLIAILLDGPQLMQRWPGRYASIFAEDPGSSVLTVTSVGLSERSVSRDSNVEDRSRVVALWKDQVTGWKEIEIPEGDSGVVLSVSATWHEEQTSDGRGDKENSAVLEFQGFFGVRLEEPARKRQTRSESTDEGSGIRNASIKKENVDSTQKQLNSSSTQEPDQDLDLIELTIWTYFVNAALDAGNRDFLRDFRQWLLSPKNQSEISDMGRLGRLVPLISGGLNAYKQDYLEKTAKKMPSLELLYAIDLVSKMIDSVNGGSQEGDVADVASEEGLESDNEDPRSVLLLKRWESLVDTASQRLKKIHRLKKEGKSREIAQDAPSNVRDPERLNISIPPSILWAVHHRLTDLRRHGNLSPDGAKLLLTIENTLDEYV